ncbi:CHRD domain-containing protein [Xylophilus ampelinus]|uniref:CHRD domain-containing protein n=1 Tax=Xylophilus ampelinus TaxID=54067 RepID=A0A318SRY7_9BURK|nr:CHRD domain-containing protein [Xylophilus ampelinus]MCS4509004.1 CHRD domain-containing protein [Xylophilus ampelinus]PYE79970.1 CHRD domain-containing protein [Xylophilus ampelinus]
MTISRRLSCTLLASAAVLALAAGCTTVTSNTATLTARLSGDQEVPPVQTLGQGTAQIWYNKQTNGLRWKVVYSGLSSPATAAHFHGPAAIGANAGVVVPFKGPLSGTEEGEVVITPAQGEELLSGLWYVNVHTSNHPAGEIRGQVTLVR